ncbi:LacI family transcriptional regulator [Gemmatimonadetes bacterium T265]|nr:LacI family transcriptional regulator [Gemmatimonadetes bacterium T265]
MTLDAVAKRARVSTATVSRVLNGADGVRPATRLRVLRAVEALNYTPNLNARALAGAESRTLGMVVSNIANPFFLDIFRSVEAGARARGYDVVVANSDYAPDRLASHVGAMLGRRVAGLALVVSETVPAAAVRALGERGRPVVLYDGGSHRLRGVPNIRADYRGGMARIVEHLHGLGHRRMAFVGHHARLGPLHDRRQAFLAAAAEYAPRMLVKTVEGTDGLAGGRDGIATLLDAGFRPTAVACVNDVMAVGAMHALHARGLAVPEDVSVTGFDNIALAEFARPPLTTADVPREAVGRLICDALLAPHDAGPVGAELVVETPLVVRESTAPPRGS